MESYTFHDIIYQTLIKLYVDICKRNVKNKLIWFRDKNNKLKYEPKLGEMILNIYWWFANQSCPGDCMYAKMGELAEKVMTALGSGNTTTREHRLLRFLRFTRRICKEHRSVVYRRAEENWHPRIDFDGAVHSRIPAYGKSELAPNANNVFGMKCFLSGNTWSGSIGAARASTPSRRRSSIRMTAMR